MCVCAENLSLVPLLSFKCASYKYCVIKIRIATFICTLSRGHRRKKNNRKWNRKENKSHAQRTIKAKIRKIFAKLIHIDNDKKRRQMKNYSLIASILSWKIHAPYFTQGLKFKVQSNKSSRSTLTHTHKHIHSRRTTHSAKHT